MQLPLLWNAQSDWVAPTSLPRLPATGRVGIDVETRDDNLKSLGIGVRRGGYLVGVSIAISDGPSVYLPLRHEAGGNMDNDAVLEYLKTELKNFRGTLVGANISYDLEYLLAAGIVLHPDVTIVDMQVVEALINDLAHSYSLNAVAAAYDLPLKDETTLREAALHWGVDPKSGLWHLPASEVGAYAEYDARLPLLILERQEPLLREYELQRVYALECAVTPVLVDMTRRGIMVDMDELDRLERDVLLERKVALKEFNHTLGSNLNESEIDTTAAVIRALLPSGITLPRTDKGNLSVSHAKTSHLSHPALDLLRVVKEKHKLLTFVAGMRDHVVNGRIHPSYRQTKMDDGGAVTGRLASSHPNIQNQPSVQKDPRWRRIYKPDGELWACCDYSSQEPRWMTHFGEELGLPGAAAAAQEYRDNPAMDFHAMTARITEIGRKEAKTIGLGIAYRMGIATLAERLSLPAHEASNILRRFNHAVPFVAGAASVFEGQARTHGYVTTHMGRRAHFPKDQWGRFDFVHKAFNRVVQGSAADQTKKALVDIARAGYSPQAQVHDEIDLTVSNRAEAEVIADIMINCMPIRVPSRVDVETGLNWGDLQ